MIGVADCDRDPQERAVEGWLRDNTPNEMLAVSLRRDGFLDENVSKQLVKRTTTQRARTSRHVRARC
jgi:hypothetical protein